VWICLQRGLYTGGDKIENHLSPTTRAALAAYLQRTGQAPTALSAMRPWLADMPSVHACARARARGAGNQRPWPSDDACARARARGAGNQRPWPAESSPGPSFGVKTARALGAGSPDRARR
jgi:hypothetical protein